MDKDAWIAVTLREWFESQRLEHTPHRAALISALNCGDTGAIRELLSEAAFNGAQRRYLEDLLERWETSRLAPGESKD